MFDKKNRKNKFDQVKHRLYYFAKIHGFFGMLNYCFEMSKLCVE